MKKQDYYRIETVRIILFPILLIFVTWFFVSQGWVTQEQSGIVWIIIAIQVIANLLAIGLVKLFDSK